MDKELKERIDELGKQEVELIRQYKEQCDSIQEKGGSTVGLYDEYYQRISALRGSALSLLVETTAPLLSQESPQEATPEYLADLEKAWNAASEADDTCDYILSDVMP